MKRITFVIFLALAAGSCKREPYPEAIVDEPIFKMSGTLNGSAFSLAAGQNDLYMDASSIQNEFGVYELTCNFEKVSCSSCDPIFSFLINDSETSPQGAPCTPDVLESGQIPLVINSNSSDFLELNFNLPNLPMDYEISWNFGDGNTAGNDHNLDHIYQSSGTYVVTVFLEDESPSGNDVTIRQSIKVGSSMFLSKPFDVQNLPGDGWKFYYNESQIQPYLHVDGWEINGNSYSGNMIEIDSDDVIVARLNFTNTILNETGFYEITFDGDENGQIPDLFFYNWEAQDLNIGKIELVYTSNEGQRYSSMTPLNNAPDSFFEILEVLDYENGISGKAAKKVDVLFTLKMINVDEPTDVITFENVNAELGFVYE